MTLGGTYIIHYSLDGMAAIGSDVSVTFLLAIWNFNSLYLVAALALSRGFEVDINWMWTCWRAS